MHEASLLPPSRLRLTTRQATMANRFASVTLAGGPSLVRTSIVAERCRVAHQRQLDDVLDLAAAELGPDPLVFASRFVFCRMRRPVDAEMPEVVETHRDGTSALI